MKGLYSIPGITTQAADLLEAAGFAVADDLVVQDPEKLRARLEILNQQLRLLPTAPNLLQVNRWIENAKMLLGQKSNQTSAVPSGLQINLDDIPEVVIVDSGPAQRAAEVPKVVRKSPEFGGAYAPPLVDSGNRSAGAPVVPASVSQVPEVILAPQKQGVAAPGTYKAVPEAGSRAVPRAIAPRPAEQPQAARSEVWKQVDAKRFASFDDYASGVSGIRPLKRTADDEPAVEEPAVDDSEEEEDEDFAKGSSGRRRIKASQSGHVSRWVKRGVEHPQPGKVHLAAFVTVVQRFLMVAVVIGTPIALAIPMMNEVDVNPPLMQTPIGMFLPVIGLWLISTFFFFAIAWRMRCRICTCKLFQAINTHKHMKSHRVAFCGFVVSLAIHALLFGWFRCMYCGTAIRLRE